MTAANDAPARVCALPTCDTVLERRQRKYCCQDHQRAEGPRKITEPESKVCKRAACGKTFVRRPRYTSPEVWETRKYCGHACAAADRVCQVAAPKPVKPRRARVRRPVPAPCPVIPPAPKVAVAVPAAPDQPWRPSAPGWPTGGPVA